MDRQKSLEVKNLRISFRTNAGKVQAVRDISFDLYKGETLAIVGESGSGKSVTSKAILGIQAGNAIYEGGEILYDGQDLLKISEEDFYKLRGDKIAMIFQDPLSSLNPIMRIGKQLTEAMLLKGKARQKASRVNSKQKIALLQKYMQQNSPASADETNKQIEVFKSFELEHARLEQEYNAAYDAASEAVVEIDDALFRISKNALDDIKNRVRKLRRFVMQSVDEFVVPEKEKSTLESLSKAAYAHSKRAEYSEEARRALEEELSSLSSILKSALNKEKPDFYALGYARFVNKASQSADISRMNAENNKLLKIGFLDSFSALAQGGVSYADGVFAAKRAEALKELGEAEAYLNTNLSDTAELKRRVEQVCSKVDASINDLDIVKDSMACTFSGSLKDFRKTYMTGLRTNAKKQRKYDRQMARYNKRIEKGKAPDWKVAAASTIDLEQVRLNMLEHVRNLKEHYTILSAELSAEETARKTERLLDYLKENTSGMVFKVTKSMAKQRALKLMEEVGIPEPEKRYRSYPFEFSGGMRQRIVIAIALAANPDILICDEPTTALDVTIQAQILDLLKNLKSKIGSSIMLITHDLGVVADMADYVVVMYAGRIVEKGLARDIFHDPRHPYTIGLMKSKPVIGKKVDSLYNIPGSVPNPVDMPDYCYFRDRCESCQEACAGKYPPMYKISDTHYVSCWQYADRGEVAEQPKSVNVEEL